PERADEREVDGERGLAVAVARAREEDAARARSEPRLDREPQDAERLRGRLVGRDERRDPLRAPSHAPAPARRLSAPPRCRLAPPAAPRGAFPPSARRGRRTARSQARDDRRPARGGPCPAGGRSRARAGAPALR